MLFWIIGATILGSLGAVAGAALFLFFRLFSLWRGIQNLPKII